jgi:hypothetical protein
MHREHILDLFLPHKAHSSTVNLKLSGYVGDADILKICSVLPRGLNRLI